MVIQTVVSTSVVQCLMKYELLSEFEKVKMKHTILCLSYHIQLGSSMLVNKYFHLYLLVKIK